MKTLKQLEKEKEKIEKQIEELKSKKTIIIDKVEYELTQHDNGKKLSEIKIPKGWRLLKPWEAQRLWDLNYLRDNWFYVENTNREEKSEGNVARFGANSYRSSLDCGWVPSDADDALGVIFCRDVGGKK